MIVIIGATSFIGLNTAEAFLKAGYEVVGTGRNHAAGKLLKNFGAEFLELDITDKAAFERLPKDNVSGVVNVAAFMPVNSSVDLDKEENAAEYFRVNVLGTINVLEYCRKNGISKLLGASSFADMAGVRKEIITEDEPRNFPFVGDHVAYVISKNAANDLMEYYNQQHQMQCAWFRFPAVYGIAPNNINSFRINGQKMTPGIPTFIERARNGEDIEVWGNPHIKKDMVYVKDVAQAYVQAMESTGARGLYNMTGGMQVTLEEKVQAVIKVFGNGRGSKIIYCPEKGRQDDYPYLYCIEKAKRDFGYSPQYTDFVKIMEDYKLELESGRWNDWLNSR